MSRMRAEILEAPEAAARLLGEGLGEIMAAAKAARAFRPRLIVANGRGSSGHAATYLRYLIGIVAGLPTADELPSLATIYGCRSASWKSLHIAISQSGESPDVVEPLRAARAAGAMTLAFVNAPDSPLAAAAEHVVRLRSGPEASVAATKTVIASLSAVAAFAALLAADDELLSAARQLPGRLAASIDLDLAGLMAPLAAAPVAVIIARGIGLAIAGECALKLSETCGIAAVAYSSAEFAHGPQAILNSRTPVIALRQSDSGGASVAARAAALRLLGFAVFELGGAPPLHPLLDPILALPPFYSLCESLAARLGRDPDRPPNLQKITKTL